LHADEIPLRMTLVAGSTSRDIISLNWSPSAPRERNITVQDPSQIACCNVGGVARTNSQGTCAYTRDLYVRDTGCVCGQTVDGRALAFEDLSCGNFETRCEDDGQCPDDNVCLTGTCCGEGVCVDPYKCSAEGTDLVGGRQ
jgi:hypothetical protein